MSTHPVTLRLLDTFALSINGEEVTVAAAGAAPAPTAQRFSGWAMPFAAADPAPPARRTVRATTRALSNAFPSLTLAVDPAGLPWLEVILTTCADLFAAERAGQRTPDNFYASRQDGLTRSDDAHGRYNSINARLAEDSATSQPARLEFHPDG